jgi:hypothetical protein
MTCIRPAVVLFARVDVSIRPGSVELDSVLALRCMFDHRLSSGRFAALVLFAGGLVHVPIRTGEVFEVLADVPIRLRGVFPVEVRVDVLMRPSSVCLDCVRDSHKGP